MGDVAVSGERSGEREVEEPKDQRNSRNSGKSKERSRATSRQTTIKTSLHFNSTTPRPRSMTPKRRLSPESDNLESLSKRQAKDHANDPDYHPPPDEDSDWIASY